MTQNRLFPRIVKELEVSYEFVSWKETSLKKLSSPKRILCRDISATGIGLVHVPEVDPGTVKKLTAGTMKVRLALSLDGRPPIHLFARLVWAETGPSGDDLIERAGFTFLDISKDNFHTIKEFVEKNLTS